MAPGAGNRRRRERALTFLAQLAVRSAGYRVEGVRGWAHPDDFCLLAGDQGWAEVLAALDGDRLVDALDARPPAAERPALIYRITQAGMDEIAGALREATRAVRPRDLKAPGAAAYVSQGARWALGELRGTPGEWMSVARVKEPSERWNREENRYGQLPNRWVYESHLRELVSAGLAECQRAPESKLYRATAAGLSQPLLQWAGQDPEHPIYSEVDGPLLREPLGCFLYGSGN